MTNVRDWDTFLDSMEARLERAGRAADGERLLVEDFARPVGLGPLPARCRERAAAILHATMDMEERVAAESADLSRKIQRASSATAEPVDRPAPSYVNRLA